jgi:hypothetical protein
MEQVTGSTPTSGGGKNFLCGKLFELELIILVGTQQRNNNLGFPDWRRGILAKNHPTERTGHPKGMIEPWLVTSVARQLK